MTPISRLHAPLFGVGFKAYVWGRKALELARIVEEIAKDSPVYLHVIPQLIDVATIARETTLPVFSPHLSSIRPGRGTGQVLAESVKESGAVGAMINHVEHRVSLTEIDQAIRRAREVGLLSMVCADSPEEARAIATLKPDIIVSEPPSRIGTLRSISEDSDFVVRSVKMVKEIDSSILVICGAGVSSGNDVAELVRLGVDGTGASRGIDESKDPRKVLAEMIKALESGWQLRK